MSDSVKWKVSAVHSNKCAIIPCPDSGNLQCEQDKPVEMYVNKEQNKVFVKCTNGKVNFSGTTTLKPQTMQYLAVEDVETGEVEFFPAYKLPLKRCLEYESYSRQDQRSYGEKYEDFTKNFGTKKLQNVMKSREKLQVSQLNASSVANDTLDDTVLEERSMNDTLTEASADLPQKNTSYTSVREVYNLSEVLCNIEEECYDSYARNNWELEAVTKDKLLEWATNGTYSKYVIQRLAQVSKDPTMRTNQLRCLAAYDIFTFMYKLKVGELRSRDAMPRVDEPYKSALLDIFCKVSRDSKGRGLRSMSAKAKDKLIAHSLLVQLYLENFKIDMSILQNDIKVPNSRIQNIAFALGCHVIQARSPSGITTRTAVLKLPLFEAKPDKRRSAGR